MEVGDAAEVVEAERLDAAKERKVKSVSEHAERRTIRRGAETQRRTKASVGAPYPPFLHSRHSRDR